MSAYAWWLNALAGNPGEVHDGDAQVGFYRRKRHDGTFAPAAIFEHHGALVCIVDGKQRDPAEEWSWLYAHPVTEKAYRAAESGEGWPDVDKAIAASQRPGSNEPADEAEILRDQIESARAGVSDYAEVGDDETAARAQSLRSRLLELGGDADKRREKAKRPHFEAAKAVDATWMPMVKTAKEAADVIARALGKFETAKAKAAAEARRLAEEERRRAEATGKPAPEPEAPAAPEPVTRIKGGYGRAASVRVRKVVTVVDQDAVYHLFRNNPELVALIAKLAQRAVEAGAVVPGVEINEERKIA